MSGVIKFGAHVIHRPDDLTDRPADQACRQRRPSSSAITARGVSSSAGAHGGEYQTEHRYDVVHRSGREGAVPPTERGGGDRRSREAISSDHGAAGTHGYAGERARQSRPALHSLLPACSGSQTRVRW